MRSDEAFGEENILIHETTTLSHVPSFGHATCETEGSQPHQDLEIQVIRFDIIPSHDLRVSCLEIYVMGKRPHITKECDMNIIFGLKPQYDLKQEPTRRENERDVCGCAVDLVRTMR